MAVILTVVWKGTLKGRIVLRTQRQLGQTSFITESQLELNLEGCASTQGRPQERARPPARALGENVTRF
jgi:hypothetical protein